MSEIVDVRAFEVLDSRGNPTVMAEVTLNDDSMGSACAPSGSLVLAIDANPRHAWPLPSAQPRA